MRPLSRLLPLLSLAVTLLPWPPCGNQVFGQSKKRQKDRQALEFFEKKIRPVLVKRCYECHAADSKEVKGELLLDTREGIRRGGESGHAVVPGNVADSLLIASIRYQDTEMPPDKPLPETVIADFVKWIEMGAPDPRDGAGTKPKKKVDLELARKFWSFQPIGDHAAPQVDDPKWPRDVIDRYVLARLEAEEIKPNADARPEVLIRRLYFDLIGLPPTPEQVEAFVKDPSQRAFAQQVDQLLDSPQFGERWGRHWLDVVRYAESTGMERNYTYPYAWRYRDYVIKSFNMDKPFDQFITEQVAGDLMSSDTREQRDERLIATGMLALGTKSLNERDREKFKMDVVDEQIDVTTRAFIGLTVSCARCHDHKFDPIPTKEYYAMAGVFCSTNTYYGTGGGNGNRQAGQLLSILPDGVQPARSGAGRQGKGNSKQLANQLRAAQRRLNQLRKQSGKNGQAKAKLATTEAQIQRLKKQLAKQKSGRKADVKAKPATTGTLVMGVQDAASPGDTQVRIRGEAGERGETIPRGFLSIVPAKGGFAKLGETGSGRTELAQWLTHKDNPLTARVAANRIWLHLFGRGIVKTVNNFGFNGEKPTHPELLDHLARQFQENGWSTKKMVRQLVLSRTYQLSSAPHPEAEKRDPENVLLARSNQRRLEGEAIRDAMLAVSGQLDLVPAEGSIVQTVGDGNIGRTIQAARFQSDKFKKRSVYLPIVRGAVPEMLNVFDFPDPSIIFGQREITTVPTQALYMMNSPFVAGRADELAARLLAEEDMDETRRLVLAYRLCLCRAPLKIEIERARAFLDKTRRALDGNQANAAQAEHKAWSGVCQAMFASSEFRYLN